MTLRIEIIILLLSLTSVFGYGQTDHKKLSFGANIGYSSLTMNDLNSYISNHFNAAGFNFNEINGCLNTGAQANYHVSRRIAFRLGFDYFIPFKQSDTKLLYRTDADGSVIGKSNLKVNLVTRAYDFYFEPLYKFFQGEKFRFMAGAGVLYSFGKLKLKAEDEYLDYYDQESWKNSAFGFLVNGDFEYYLKPFFSLLASLKIQYNLIPDLKDQDGNKVYLSKEIISDGSISLDYSGVSLNVGLLIYPFHIKNSK